MPAPTPDEILANGLDFAISCKTCRELRAPHDLVLALVTAGRGAVPADRLTFRCQRCGSKGEPWITGPGNMLIGKKRYWPPPSA